MVTMPSSPLSVHLRIHACTVERKESSSDALFSSTASRRAAALAGARGTINSPSSSAATARISCSSVLAPSTFSSVRCTITSSVFTRFVASDDSAIFSSSLLAASLSSAIRTKKVGDDTVLRDRETSPGSSYGAAASIDLITSSGSSAGAPVDGGGPPAAAPAAMRRELSKEGSTRVRPRVVRTKPEQSGSHAASRSPRRRALILWLR
mmetsp:Transcript_3661/g.7623  ORF Transcript_3661/g.7623 Transcript_3661/m.7623 type:complete len:208 (+) Transcript_3661:507-1130(+)